MEVVFNKVQIVFNKDKVVIEKDGRKIFTAHRNSSGLYTVNLSAKKKKQKHS